MKNKISIIIPVYNGEEYIDRCLDSILNQTYKNYEIILIDDGSKDNSYKIIKKWQKKYNDVIVCLKQNNKGAGPARNKGLEVASGDYVVFLDADDYLDFDFLEVMIKNVGDYDIVISGFRRINENKVFYSRSLEDNNWAKFQQLVIWAKIYNLDFIKKNKILFSKIKTGQDVAFSFECYSYSPNIKIIDYVGYNYYYNVNSITHNRKIQVDNDVIFMYNYILKCIKNTEFFEKNMDDVVFFFYKDIIARLCRKSGFVKYKQLCNLEVIYYEWLINFLDDYDLKFKYIYEKNETKFINLLIFCYVLFRKIGLRRVFLLLLFLKKYD